MFTPMVTTTFSVSPIAVVAANSPVFTLKGSIATVWPFDILVYSAAGAHAFAMEQSASRRHLSSNAQLFSGIASTLAFFRSFPSKLFDISVEWAARNNFTVQKKNIGIFWGGGLASLALYGATPPAPVHATISLH